MKKIVFISLTFALTFCLSAQNTSWTSYLEQLADAEEINEDDLENLYEELTYLSEHPFNIHTMTKTDLERLPFLNAIQIENLLYYIYKYQPIVDLYELKNVEDLDRQTLMYLLPFVYLGETENSPERSPVRLKYSKQELAVHSHYTLQPQAGYSDGKYAGDPLALSFRYRWNSGDRIQFGLTGEKDPGEAFWNERKKGFDFYTMNLTIKELGYLKTLSLGAYRLSFGEGLILNNHFSLGKTADATHIHRQSTGIQRHLSTNENQYFNGIASAWQWGQWEATGFYSHRLLDATADSAFIYSIQTDGFHRTINELNKEKQAEANLFGGNIQWRNDRLSLGTTAIYYSFGDKATNPEWKPYNMFYFRGKTNANTGFHYSYRRKRWILQGETAWDASGKPATLHSLLVTPASGLEWVAAFRSYAKDYQATYARALAESSTVQNETGFYTGIKINFLTRWELTAYWDYFRFPWLKYGIDSPSSGNDWLVQLNYFPRANWQMNFRYKQKEKAQNAAAAGNIEYPVNPVRQHRLRYQSDYRPNPKLRLKSQADYHLVSASEKRSAGWSFTQTLSYSIPSAHLQLDGSCAYFHTDDWDSRISLYEKNVLYASGFSTYYGHGLRYYLLFQWKIARPLTVYLKAGSTHYFDRNSIGSGPEEIQGKEKSMVYGTVKYSF
ncbi:MAG: helix-hairpin-helix domain-containing protein [Dysgonamonadaceae bacterium]|jgi:hypothetical protein|nr:helix-hairpin-helix domain-containing protein [Dysgonamonadaceae bacterium]